MSALYRYKPMKDDLFRPLLSTLRSLGISPNMVTVSGLLMSLSGAILAASGSMIVGLLLFVMGACLDCLDGSLARFSKRCTQLGRYLDGYCDRVSEVAFIIGAVIGGAPVLALVIAIGSVAQLAVRTALHMRGIGSDSAWFSRPERLASIIIGLLLPFPFGPMVLGAGGLLCVLSIIHIFLRMDLRAGSTSIEKKAYET